MARFEKGKSGNPSGRPRSAVGLRELLEDRYGSNAAVLVGRLEKLSVGRTPRLALEATKLLLSYHCGMPGQALAVSGVLQHGRYEIIRPDLLSRLTDTQLEVLRQLNSAELSDDPDNP